MQPVPACYPVLQQPSTRQLRPAATRLLMSGSDVEMLEPGSESLLASTTLPDRS